MRHAVQFLICVIVSVITLARGAGPVDFKRDIQPILEQRCYECHGEQKQKSGLRLDRKAAAFSVGDSGQPAILPSQSAASPLILRITSKDPDEVMPPKGEALSEAQVALLRQWIDQGAVWPDDGVKEKRHWAYDKPVRHPLPKVKNKKWPRNSIDYFVLEKLEKEKLKPSLEADRATLIRRVSLDLTGLPPTLQEVDEFLADKSANAFEKVVDRLLASPQFGERWARPWLDLARYADTAGYESDARRTMWPWRDWVIAALNKNMPFNEFTIEQLAGDLLPNPTREQKVATGFHRNTMTNNEGGTDDEEFRHEAVVDRVNTTMAAWMATTISCAQCHNHKYDPITMKEFYQLYAFLNSTADSDKQDDRPTMKVPTVEQEIGLARRRETLKSAEKKFKEATARPEIAAAQLKWERVTTAALTNWQALDPIEFTSTGGATLTKQPSGALLVSGTNPSNDTYHITAKVTQGTVTGLRLEVLDTGELKELGRGANSRFVLRALEAAVLKERETSVLKFTKAAADFSEKNFDIKNLLTGKGDGWTIATSDSRTRVRRSAYFTLEKPLEVESNATLSFTLKHSDKFAGANLMRFRIYATSSEEVGAPASVSNDVRTILLTEAEKRDDKQRAKLKEYFQSIAPELKEPREALAAARKAEKEWNDAIPIVAVLEELPKPRETHMLMRGSFLTKGERVRPGVPAVFNSIDTNQPSNRLTLAKWLVDTNNPLTARVMMNRFWDQIFGMGLVDTAEDFGTQGEPPSHPQLLDWLACEFMSSSRGNEAHSEKGENNQSLLTSAATGGWDMKRMLKLIVTSATYRQSSKVTAKAFQRDPYNRLLARGPRRRLEAEMVRDQALAVSGLLSRKAGGPSVMPPQPDGVWQVVYSGDKWETSKGEDKYRRGVYTFWRRTSPYPSMVSFDAPSREFCVVRRTRSNTPLQALTLLNDPVYVECAQALAKRMLTEGGPTDEERAAFGLRACLARAPRRDEAKKLAGLAQKELTRYRKDLASAAKLVKFAGANDKEPTDPAELAAWTVVANVLLNLDEFVMKP
ncbi:MAG TPA: PSD1 and planctomycete cytochrome C domain-containing protein [Methylomirabilota bacterium]|nr:PSD1 and planctomycete cytochrome C domain-containing protein [Methylomirabilota bacterium]